MFNQERKKMPKKKTDAAPPAKVKRETEWVSADQWVARLTAIENMNARERQEFEMNRRVELSIEDLRDEITGAVIAQLGGGVEDKAFELCHARGGPHPSTLKAWADRSVHRPWTSKMRQAGLTIGWDLKWVQVN